MLLLSVVEKRVTCEYVLVSHVSIRTKQTDYDHEVKYVEESQCSIGLLFPRYIREPEYLRNRSCFWKLSVGAQFVDWKLPYQLQEKGIGYSVAVRNMVWLDLHRWNCCGKVLDLAYL